MKSDKSADPFLRLPFGWSAAGISGDSRRAVKEKSALRVFKKDDMKERERKNPKTNSWFLPNQQSLTTSTFKERKR